MKKFNTSNLLKSFLTLAAIITVNFSFGKTFTTINSGKWSDASTWDNGTPGALVAANDEVIVKNHITMNVDVAVKGTLTIGKGISVMSNKTLIIATEGKLVNNGNLTVKRIVNEGTINNNSMIESMNDIENEGSVNNNSNMMVGTNLLNFGGNVAGIEGTYFANGTVLASLDAKFGKNIKIYANPDQNNSTASTMSLEAEQISGNVILTVNNPNNEPVNEFTIEKSYNGKTFERVTDVTASNSTIAMVYQDKNIAQETVSYKVKVNGTDYLPQATVRVALASASIR